MPSSYSLSFYLVPRDSVAQDFDENSPSMAPETGIGGTASPSSGRPQRSVWMQRGRVESHRPDPSRAARFRPHLRRLHVRSGRLRSLIRIVRRSIEVNVDEAKECPRQPNGPISPEPARYAAVRNRWHLIASVGGWLAALASAFVTELSIRATPIFVGPRASRPCTGIGCKCVRRLKSARRCG